MKTQEDFDEEKISMNIIIEKLEAKIEESKISTREFMSLKLSFSK